MIATWMVAMSAQRATLVQMLEVAFSRRMCCSRVWSVSTKPRLPSRSTVAPTSRPGIRRDDEQGARGVRDLGRGLDVFQAAEEVRVLDDDRRRLRVHGFAERVQ